MTDSNAQQQSSGLQSAPSWWRNCELHRCHQFQRCTGREGQQTKTGACNAEITHKLEMAFYQQRAQQP